MGIYSLHWKFTVSSFTASMVLAYRSYCSNQPRGHQFLVRNLLHDFQSLGSWTCLGNWTKNLWETEQSVSVCILSCEISIKLTIRARPSTHYHSWIWPMSKNILRQSSDLWGIGTHQLPQFTGGVAAGVTQVSGKLRVQWSIGREGGWNLLRRMCRHVHAWLGGQNEGDSIPLLKSSTPSRK